VMASFLVVNSVIAFFYYLRVIRTMWMEPAPEDAPTLAPGAHLSFVVVALTLLTVLLGVLPGLVSSATSLAGLAAG